MDTQSVVCGIVSRLESFVKWFLKIIRTIGKNVGTIAKFFNEILRQESL